MTDLDLTYLINACLDALAEGALVGACDCIECATNLAEEIAEALARYKVSDRETESQRPIGQRVASWADVQPGDAVFFEPVDPQSPVSPPI